MGNGYYQGVFTAPASGVYLFYSSVVAALNDDLWCQIVVNGSNKATIYAKGSNDRFGQGSQSIIVNMNKGDTVEVQNLVPDHTVYSDVNLYTTFSGVLLQPTFP